MFMYANLWLILFALVQVRETHTRDTHTFMTHLCRLNSLDDPAPPPKKIPRLAC